MIAAFSELWNAILNLIATAPLGLWTLVIAVVLSSLLAQRVKFWLPSRWPKMGRTAITQLTAFFSAMFVTWALWPVPIGLFSGAIAGLISPTLYAITVRLIGIKRPDLRDLLSKDDPDDDGANAEHV